MSGLIHTKLPLTLALAGLVSVLSTGCVVRERSVVADGGAYDANASDAQPPAEQPENPGPPPSREHFWMKGHWRWSGRSYQWVQGHWETRRGGYEWEHGHWESRGHRWIWIEGGWRRT